MTSLRIAHLALFALFATPFAAACSSSSNSGGSSSCSAGATQSCTCATGGSGTQDCLSDGVWGGCQCAQGGDGGLDATASTDTGTGGDGPMVGMPDSSIMCNGCGDGGGIGDATPLDAAAGAFGSSCTTDSDCTSDDCFDFPAKGQFCTQPCTQASDCPPQSGGCNGMGQCKVP